ncbi:hypothetical protein pVa21_224 [Vibrio phage pVa-21]|nr:hypothetical protein pVa21_224 [Vibrio phage pVa-21]
MDITGLVGGLNYIEARVELIRAFDTDYDIDSGSSLVEMSKAEKMTPGSLYEYWAEIYDQYKIWDRWHLSFDEYIDRPSFMMESLNQTAERLNKKDLEAAEKIKQEAERERLRQKVRNGNKKK